MNDLNETRQKSGGELSSSNLELSQDLNFSSSFYTPQSSTSLALPFSFGNIAFQIGKARTGNSTEHSHRWMVFFRGAHNQDLSFAIEKVVFHLHQSFAEPIRVVTAPPFQVTETGWGSFDIQIKVYFHPALGVPGPLHLTHLLKLFHETQGVPPDRPVVSEHYDEVVFNNPSEEVKAIFRGRSEGDAPPYPHQEHLGIFSAEPDLAAIRAARQWVKERMIEQEDRMVKRESEAAVLRQHVSALI